MPKPMYVWTGTAWVSVASEVESLATYATQSYADNTPGMKMIVPSSVAVGSGTASVATQGTVTFSGASSLTLNNIFSSTYDNYRFLIKATSNNTYEIAMRMRTSGGSDDSGSNYFDQYFESYGSSSYNLRQTSQTYMTLAPVGDSGINNISVDVFSPYLAEFTTYNALSNRYGGVSSQELGITAGGHNQNTSYPSCTLIVPTGTITGTIRVYGYKAG